MIKFLPLLILAGCAPGFPERAGPLPPPVHLPSSPEPDRAATPPRQPPPRRADRPVIFLPPTAESDARWRGEVPISQDQPPEDGHTVMLPTDRLR